MDKMKGMDDEELVGSSGEQKNWRGILLAILVILIVISLVIAAVIILTPKDEKQIIGEPFTFEDFLDDELKPKQFLATWLPDRNIYVYQSREKELMQYDAEHNVTTVIMDNSTFRQYNTDLYYIASDLRYVLIAYDKIQVYRHSFKAKYFIYDRQATDHNDRIIQFPRSADSSANEWSNRYLQYAEWAPQGSGLTFVYGNNLYYQQSPHTTPNIITTNGQAQTIFNGIPDWVYEEEILHSNKAHWWSPDASKICYGVFNDTVVPSYYYPYYGKGENIYGTIEKVAYPKAGDQQKKVTPSVKLYIYDTNGIHSLPTEITPPTQLAKKEHYITHVEWQDDNRVMVNWLNRPQNASYTSICLVTSGECYSNWDESSGNVGWVENYKPIFGDGNEYFTLQQYVVDHERGNFRHIALITTPVGRKGTRRFLTQGLWDVIEIVAYDQQMDSIYYISTNRDPRKRHLFRLPVDRSHRPEDRLPTPECLTCGLSDSCQYVSASFSSNALYYILSCLGPAIPQYILKSNIDNRHIILEDNAKLAQMLKKKALPRRQFHQVDVDGGYKVWAEVLLPSILNEEEIYRYPLLVDTYGGPGSQKVTFEFSLGWSTYLSSSRHVIYVHIDGRGTGGRGYNFMTSLYKNLGTVEVEDQITVIRYLANKLPALDQSRMAIWGWSYGGFVSSHVLGTVDTPFQCAVAVAPVIDWRYYDTVYTERYMNLASENWSGYYRANVSSKVKNFKGKNFMLVHGTADDNVHFQNTAQLVKALIEEDVDFRTQIYPDENHSLSSGRTNRHVHRSITRFLEQECWRGGKRLSGDDMDYES